MGIEVADAPSSPSVVFNKVFLHDLRIVQARVKHKDDHPNYHVRVHYSMFGEDTDGNIHYSPEGVQAVSVADYLARALSAMQEGQADYLQALAAIEAAVAALVAKDRNTSTTVI